MVMWTWNWEEIKKWIILSDDRECNLFWSPVPPGTTNCHMVVLDYLFYTGKNTPVQWSRVISDKIRNRDIQFDLTCSLLHQILFNFHKQQTYYLIFHFLQTGRFLKKSSVGKKKLVSKKRQPFWLKRKPSVKHP